MYIVQLVNELVTQPANVNAFFNEVCVEMFVQIRYTYFCISLQDYFIVARTFSNIFQLTLCFFFSLRNVNERLFQSEFSLGKGKERGESEKKRGSW